MSRVRQNVQIDENDILVRTLSLKLSNNHLIHGHEHPWGQIVFASRGVMQVDADSSRWAVPPMRCLWMPPSVDHSIKFIGETWMRTIYIGPELAEGLSKGCKILNVPPLLREMMLETVRRRMLLRSVKTDRHLADVLIDQLTAAEEMSLKIIMPVDDRAVRLADIISNDPANRSPLTELARSTGASPRTLERLFVQQTGISIGRWRQQARLMLAIRLLVEGRSVNQAGSESGYESPSAFVAMFKREFGTTPGQYLRNSSP